jgi:hypothetical protein
VSLRLFKFGVDRRSLVGVLDALLELTEFVLVDDWQRRNSGKEGRREGKSEGRVSCR